MITVADIARAVEAIADKSMAAAWAEHLAVAMERFEVNSARRAAAFLANAAEESHGFTKTEEALSYSAERLMEVWKGRFSTLEFASQYAHAPEKLANYVYSNRNGNGPPDSGDGWAFRGGGLIQLTGRGNYRRSGGSLGLPLEANPDLVRREPEVASLTAAEYWSWTNCNLLADDEHLTLICKRINGGLNGLEERNELYKKALQALKAG
jgi:putative chitinase